MTKQPALISISIDIAGSTEAKTQIFHVTSNDPEQRQRLDEDIYKIFMSAEDRFYSHLAWGKDNLDFNMIDLFNIKGIGDEIWIACDVNLENQYELDFKVHRIIAAAMEVVQRDVTLNATEFEEGPNFDPNFNYGDTKPIRGAFKASIDLIEHATEISRLRQDFFEGKISRYLDGPDAKDKDATKPSDEIWQRAYNRLALGYVGLLKGRKLCQISRSDYIGHEVDRFFRLAGQALPGTITVGKALFNCLSKTQSPTSNLPDNVLQISCKNPKSLTSGNSYGNVRYWLKKQITRAGDFSGIDYDYELFHVFDPGFLRGKYSYADSACEGDIPAYGYSQTREVITDDLIKNILSS